MHELYRCNFNSVDVFNKLALGPNSLCNVFGDKSVVASGVDGHLGGLRDQRVPRVLQVCGENSTSCIQGTAGISPPTLRGVSGGP